MNKLITLIVWGFLLGALGEAQLALGLAMMIAMAPIGFGWLPMAFVVLDLAIFIMAALGDGSPEFNYLYGAWFLASIIQGPLAFAFPGFNLGMVGLGIALAIVKMASICVLARRIKRRH